MLIGVGLVVWKKKVGGEGHQAFNTLSKEEIELLIADAAKNNPAILKRFADNPELKKTQLESFRELLAEASEAQSMGLADQQTNKQELDSIAAEVIAVNYDREINKDKGPMPPFGFVTDDQIKAYWGEDDQPAVQKSGFSSLMDKLGLGHAADSRTHAVEFEDFLNAKIDLLKQGNPEMKDREISDEEKEQAKEVFAKIRIYRKEFNQKADAGQLDPQFVAKVRLQVKLQQAQFLARLYAQSAKDQLEVSDDEVNKYIADHPELDPKEKRAKAEEILNRAKNGEDFAALANEFSEDPGNKGPDGKGKGGLYSDVPKGRMVPAFEQAALSLEAGQIAPNLVESDYGFHIVKLERKLGIDPNQKGPDGKPSTVETYDVRHILISTMTKDPDDPMAPEMPVKEFVKGKLAEKKQKDLMDKLIAKNFVQVPEDFDVPEITPEQMEQMKKQQEQLQQQMQMPQAPPTEGDAPADAPKKGDPAKKQDPKAAEPKKK
ncbi:MAG: Parvulin-like peptidyl-prolyl isomerase [Acidobacteria bacterium OLB17]|nr:MAG: Parvulin-like peptidyl-prolyl isomerase [Acidobacteria bacterium OLB17]